MFTSIDDKFTFDSARLGMFSFANILQIADVALSCQLCSCCSRHVFSNNFANSREMSEMSVILCVHNLNNSTSSQVCKNSAFLTSSPR